MTIKVLIIEQMLPPYGVDGKRIHVYDLAQGLSRKGVEVHIVTEKPGVHKNKLGSEGLEEFPWDNFTVHRVVPVLKKFDWPSYIALVGKYIKKLDKKYQFDIIHAHGPHAGFLAYYKPNIPVIVTVHGTFASEYKALKLDISYISSSMMSIIKKIRILSGARFYSTLEGIVCQRSDAIIALTRREKDLIMSNYGVESSKITIIPNCVDINKLKSLASKGDIDLKTEKPLALFVGRLTARKGIIQLLQAWRLLKENKCNGTLIIIGSGYLEPLIEEYTQKVSNIVLLQNVSRRNLFKIYDMVDVFVLPSLFEGFPYTLLEALAFGKPLLISEMLGFEELVGDSGQYVNPLRPDELMLKLKALLNDEELRGIMSSKAREVAANFSLDKMIERIIHVYEIVST